jgi:hypothetical protein
MKTEINEYFNNYLDIKTLDVYQLNRYKVLERYLRNTFGLSQNIVYQQRDICQMCMGYIYFRHIMNDTLQWDDFIIYGVCRRCLSYIYENKI